MKSKILQKQSEEVVKLCKKMKPQDRLVAYFHHSHLVNKMFQAGAKFRSKILQSSERSTS